MISVIRIFDNIFQNNINYKRLAFSKIRSSNIIYNPEYEDIHYFIVNHKSIIPSIVIYTDKYSIQELCIGDYDSDLFYILNNTKQSQSYTIFRGEFFEVLQKVQATVRDYNSFGKNFEIVLIGIPIIRHKEEHFIENYQELCQNIIQSRKTVENIYKVVERVIDLVQREKTQISSIQDTIEDYKTYLYILDKLIKDFQNLLILLKKNHKQFDENFLFYVKYIGIHTNNKNRFSEYQNEIDLILKKNEKSINLYNISHIIKLSTNLYNECKKAISNILENI